MNSPKKTNYLETKCQSTKDLFRNQSLEEREIKSSKEKEQSRIERPVRNQLEVEMTTLDDKVPYNHPVREIWDFVLMLDDKILNGDIKSKVGHVGRSAKDRRILFTLWLYALSEGIGSGRHIAKLIKRDDIYRWIVGKVNINYHTIDDFRSKDSERLEELFALCLAVIMKDLNITVTRMGNDGTKIRAKAKRDSFKKEDKINSYIEAAKEHLKEVEKQNEESVDLSKRKKSARMRHAKEKLTRCENALGELKKLQKKKSPKEKEKTQASISEAESRVMKFGGSSAFHPAYNVQCSEDLDTGLILAVQATDEHNDYNGLLNVMPSVKNNLGYLPDRCAADKGFSNNKQLIYMDKLGIDFYIPEVPKNISNLAPRFLRDSSTINTNEKTFSCPSGQIFNLHKKRADSYGRQEYNFDRRVKHCGNCSMDEKCFPINSGKRKGGICVMILKPRHERILNDLDKRLAEPDAEEILKLRFASELVHAKLKVHFDLTQFNVQTKLKVQAELNLTGTAYNINKWITLKNRKAS